MRRSVVTLIVNWSRFLTFAVRNWIWKIWKSVLLRIHVGILNFVWRILLMTIWHSLIIFVVQRLLWLIVLKASSIRINVIFVHLRHLALRLCIWVTNFAGFHLKLLLRPYKIFLWQLSSLLFFIIIIPIKIWYKIWWFAAECIFWNIHLWLPFISFLFFFVL
jgi:hypothetical protein